MTEPNGHVCPECAAPRAPDGTPSCACTQRASDALRDARTAEAAAAEDFDPLRIRPYVELGTEGAGPADDASAATMRLTALPSAPPSAPQAADVHLFPEQPPEPGTTAVPDERPRRRRRTAVLAVAGAVVTVVAAAGLASGLFSYDTPAHDGALPEDVRASVPDASSKAPSVSPTSPSTTSAAPLPVAPAPSHSASASPSASESSTSASPSRSATPTPTTTSPSPTTTATATRDSSDERRVQTLRRGDKGPEVTELQLRLTQLALYTGADNGKFDDRVEDAVSRYQWARGITGDEQGVYGTATRASLEAETTEP
ncbi:MULTISPECIES: peptidoglycan-binding domain-containing protein [unclassified Streptomyces]|uniref:peptidoglycan-binding domain-containing protein n=1 Tax=unclassified Streptomyces TaxID=2593676 RepID=UPI002E817C3B|nr:peptidoglycan-binding domain-containing protein [Streptomyces sp. NBC_00589]WTI39561.1 peptidoglycan-binding protein [Streptomyces sp. NBC_00775]WUB26760.1 peptidoglycan-binding protein [Streptomyces sp. NBC_00589]